MKTLLALAVIAASIPAASAQPIRAVLSAETKPYQEAWDGFQEELGDAAAMSVAGAPIEPARIVVAFGSKAALQEYRGDVILISAMAPSVELRRRGKTDVPSIAMTPSPRILLSSLRALQPGLKILAVVWKSEFYGEQYLPLLREAGKEIGVEIKSVEAGDDGELPDLLRALYGRADALWLPPDPLVINESNFFLFRDFSLSNHVPLYVPIPSLAERGATASVSVGFRAIGRAAARVALQALDGGDARRLSFPEPAETALNRDSAAKVGLAVDAETLKGLSRVIP
ncbi:MAG: ABC transporter substrate-binding protein [Elusimicrobiota bacterium]